MADQLPGEPDKPHVVVIRDEESAWAMLQAAVGLGEEAIPDNLLLKFEGWPRYKVHIDGRDWHGSVPTRIMPAILDLQKDLHRVYAELSHAEQQLIFDAARDRSLLSLQVTATKRRGNISEAIVSSARAAPKLPTAQGS